MLIKGEIRQWFSSGKLRINFKIIIVEVITDNYHIINIMKKTNGAFISATKEYSKVIRTSKITQTRNHGAELSKPSTKSLLKTIKCTNELIVIVLE